MRVVPRGTVPRRHFSGCAIGLALALYGGDRLTGAAVRRRVSPWPVATTTGWRTLGRWISAVRAGRLFPGVRAPPGAGMVLWAERTATYLAAHAPPSLRREPLPSRAFAGAAQLG